MKAVSSILLIIGALVFISILQTGLEVATRTYSGEETFNTIEEALAFQGDVVNEAAAIEAEVRECDLTKQSPPTVSFRIVAPPAKSSWLGSTPVQFLYGERVLENTKWEIIGYIIFVSIGITLVLLLIWTKRGRQILDWGGGNEDGRAEQ